MGGDGGIAAGADVDEQRGVAAGGDEVGEVLVFGALGVEGAEDGDALGNGARGLDFGGRFVEDEQAITATGAKRASTASRSSLASAGYSTTVIFHMRPWRSRETVMGLQRP